MPFTIVAALVAAVGTGCASQQLRSAYTQVNIGEPFPVSLRLPDGVTWQKENSIWRVAHQPKQSTVDGEDGITLRLDAAGRVTAKYYWCSQEEMVPLLLWFIRRDIDLWDIDIVRASVATTGPSEITTSAEISQIEAVCRQLYKSRFEEWSTRLDEIIRSISEQHLAIDKNLRYEQVRERQILPIAKRTTWRLRSIDGKRLQVSAETDIDASLVLWAAAGYWHWATTGEFPG